MAQSLLPGSASRHLGGKQAARTRQNNTHRRELDLMGGYDDTIGQRPASTLPDDKPATIIAGVVQYLEPPVDAWQKRKFGEPGDFVCPNCLKRVNWAHKEEHLVFKCPSKKQPVPPQPEVKKATPQQADEIKPKYLVGQQVWVNGYGENKIKTTRIQRTITAVRVMRSGVFYTMPIGTNTTGISHHSYPESCIEPIGKQVAPATKLQSKQLCTALMIRPAAAIVNHPFVRSNNGKIETKIETKKLDVKVLGKIQIVDSTQDTITPPTAQPATLRKTTAKSGERKPDSPIQRATTKGQTQGTQPAQP